jgi:hypothetical protein
MNLAPLVLFVYRRAEHTSRTLAALAANPEAKGEAMRGLSRGGLASTMLKCRRLGVR